MRKEVLRTAIATAAFAAVHSLLATRAVKQAAEKALGNRARNGLYRAGYNAVALGTFALLVGEIRDQPRRTLYHVRGGWALPMRVGQAAVLAMTGWAALDVGLGGFSGLGNLFAWLTGRPVPREPEGQGPAPDADGAIRPHGPFALTRQPLNFLIVPLLWLSPHMTTRLATFNAVATAYAYIGSLLTDRRLRATYGPAYEAYRRTGVPLFLPGTPGRPGPTARQPERRPVNDRSPVPSGRAAVR